MAETNKSVPDGPLPGPQCQALADALASVGDRWTALVVGTLAGGTLRYGEVRRRLPGISQRMLTLTLRRLEADGLVARAVTASVPPRVDYTLTGRGHALREALGPLQRWAQGADREG